MFSFIQDCIRHFSNKNQVIKRNKIDTIGKEVISQLLEYVTIRDIEDTIL